MINKNSIYPRMSTITATVDFDWIQSSIVESNVRWDVAEKRNVIGTFTIIRKRHSILVSLHSIFNLLTDTIALFSQHHYERTNSDRIKWNIKIKRTHHQFRLNRAAWSCSVFPFRCVIYWNWNRDWQVMNSLTVLIIQSHLLLLVCRTTTVYHCIVVYRI